ncbi:MAG: hypothetical protein QXL25_05610 [Candidatus Bathyarchaeia archaeon]
MLATETDLVKELLREYVLNHKGELEDYELRFKMPETFLMLAGGWTRIGMLNFLNTLMSCSLDTSPHIPLLQGKRRD